MNFRVGLGIDVHRLADDRRLMLGGVNIPADKGLAGHSDADAIIHAICDALLGACGLRDIGFHFPDNDPEFKDIDSRKLLERVGVLVRNHQWEIGNIDCTLVLQSPKISPFIKQMKTALANTLQVEPGAISIKATTNEGLGFIGREEGAAAYAVALVYKK